MAHSKLTLDEYAALKKRLSKVHKFSFKTRKNFTPHQKAAITRAYNKYAVESDLLKMYEAGRVQFTKVPRKFKHEFPDKEYTNKGMVYYVVKPPLKSEKPVKVKTKYVSGGRQRGLPDEYIAVIKGSILEVLIPVPQIANIDLVEFMELLARTYEPNALMVQVNGFHGKNTISPDNIAGYMRPVLIGMEKSRNKYDRDQNETYITGIFMIFPNTAEERKRWRA